jgi:hypothetical protein
VNDDDGHDQGVTLEQVQKMISDALAAKPAGPAGGRRPAERDDTPTGSIGDQVAAEVKRIKQREESEAARARTDARLAELENTAKAAAAKPPAQYKKFTVWLWGDRG